MPFGKLFQAQQNPFQAGAADLVAFQFFLLGSQPVDPFGDIQLFAAIHRQRLQFQR